MNKQKQLEFVTNFIVKNLMHTKLRGVTAEWVGDVARIHFYFHNEIGEQEREESSEACTGIIAQFPDGQLEEIFSRLDLPAKLPKSEFWAYVNTSLI